MRADSTECGGSEGPCKTLPLNPGARAKGYKHALKLVPATIFCVRVDASNNHPETRCLPGERWLEGLRIRVMSPQPRGWSCAFGPHSNTTAPMDKRMTGSVGYPQLRAGRRNPIAATMAQSRKRNFLSLRLSHRVRLCLVLHPLVSLPVLSHSDLSLALGSY